MTTEELARRLEEGTAQLLDVRSLEEYTGQAGYLCDPRQGHIPGAVHLNWEDLFAGAHPLDRASMAALLEERGVDPDRDIVCYCHSGNRSQMAVAALRAAGFERVENYEGSWHEWSRREDG